MSAGLTIPGGHLEFGGTSPVLSESRWLEVLPTVAVDLLDGCGTGTVSGYQLVAVPECAGHMVSGAGRSVGSLYG